MGTHKWMMAESFKSHQFELKIKLVGGRDPLEMKSVREATWKSPHTSPSNIEKLPEHNVSTKNKSQHTWKKRKASTLRKDEEEEEKKPRKSTIENCVKLICSKKKKQQNWEKS